MVESRSPDGDDYFGEFKANWSTTPRYIKVLVVVLAVVAVIGLLT